MSLSGMRQLHFIPIIVASLVLSSHLVPGGEPSATPKSDAISGIEGVITEGPIHGGPSREGVPDSRSLKNTDFLVEGQSGVVATFKTDDHGRFRISLPPGHYTLSMKDQKAKMGNHSLDVDVATGQMKTIQWECDTGIR